MAGSDLQQGVKRPHALVLPWPAQGHINPMMYLSTKLAASGATITFVNTQFNHERLVQSQAEAGIPLPQEGDRQLDIRLVGVPDGLGYEEYTAVDVPKHCQALIDMEPRLVKLVQELQPPVTCIIADVFFICAQSVAKQFGIPAVGFWTQNAASYAAHVIFTQGYTPPKENPVVNGEIQNLITCIPGCPPLRFKEAPTFLQPCDPSDFIFSYLIRNFQNVLECRYVLLNTFHELEAASLKFIDGPNMCTIGPILPSEFLDTVDGDNQSMKPKKKMWSSMWVEDEGCIPWLDRQKPGSVLYVSFGSLAVLSAQQIEEFAVGLEASGCPILMVVRPALMEGQQNAVFPQGFTERMSGKSLFVKWAPQLEVLGHAAVGGFLTHCGWNSVLESICRGLPMLCWPYFADQMLDCRCIVDGWKIGLDFEEDSITGLVSRGEIEQKVKFLMDLSSSREMRDRVKKLSLAAKMAVAKPDGPSYRNFESFIRFLFT